MPAKEPTSATLCQRQALRVARTARQHWQRGPRLAGIRHVPHGVRRALWPAVPTHG